MTLTEFNQNPSRVVRLLEADSETEIRVTKRGQPLFQVTRVAHQDDPIRQLIDTGLASPAAKPVSDPLAYDNEALPAGFDLAAALERDRNRLG